MTIDRYAVMGNPIAHSKSPQIHQLFARQTGQKLSYEAILVPVDGLGLAIREFFSANGKGLNITVPFKLEAWQLADKLSGRATLAGAVNTLAWQANGILYGDNTDGIGLVNDLTHNLHVALQGKRVLLLGAGGAARGVLGPLLEQQPQCLVIANRTAERAKQLAEQFTQLGQLRGCGLEALANLEFDLVINATAAGLSGEIPPLPNGVIGSHTRCYDMMYGSAPTAFVNYARQHGARDAFDGLGMLVEQAAASFHLWRGIRPETGNVIEALRDQRI